MNVADQNDAVRKEIIRLTRGFREQSESYPEALYNFLEAKGVVVARSVLVSLSTDEQGANPICGVVLTQEEKFMHFDLECSTDGRQLVDVHTWAAAAEAHNQGAHNPGFRKGRGRIALDVLRDLAG